MISKDHVQPDFSHGFDAPTPTHAPQSDSLAATLTNGGGTPHPAAADPEVQKKLMALRAQMRESGLPLKKWRAFLIDFTNQRSGHG